MIIEKFDVVEFTNETIKDLIISGTLKALSPKGVWHNIKGDIFLYIGDKTFQLLSVNYLGNVSEIVLNKTLKTEEDDSV